MTMKQNEPDWQERAKMLRAEIELRPSRPVISIDTVMRVFGYNSAASAEYALIKLESMGVVKSENGRWYLTS
jgi:predicted Rossmann fold nucleotide-binding protein DprA/Smf involved in DNA uptake